MKTSFRREVEARLAAGRERLLIMEAAGVRWRQHAGDLAPVPRRAWGEATDAQYQAAAARGVLVLPSGGAAWVHDWRIGYGRWCWNERVPYALYFVKPSGWGWLEQDLECSGLCLPEPVDEALSDDLFLLYDRWRLDPQIGGQWYRRFRTDTMWVGGFRRWGLLNLPPEPWAVLARFNAAQQEAQPDPRDECRRAGRWIE